MQINNKIPIVSDTVKKLIINNVLFTSVILLALNFILVSVLNYVLTENLDQRLKHEIEKILETISVNESGIEIKSFRELNESDFNFLTENPYFLQIYTPDGKLLLQSKNISLFKKIPIEIFPSNDLYTYKFILLDNEKLRAGYYLLKDKYNNTIAVLQLCIFAREFDKMRGEALRINLIVLPFVLILVIISSYVIAKKSFKPLNMIIDEANNISATDLSRRIVVESKDTDEMGRLRDTLNNLLDRINSYINELSNFTDQASHQLMNPLTALKSELDYLLKKERTIDEYRSTIAELKNQTEHMINIVRTLLMITKSSHSIRQSKSVINLSKLINNDIQTFFRRNNINYDIENDIYIKGDSEKISMVIQNLLNNAIKYSPDGSEVRLKLYRENTFVKLEVIDNGIGIPDSEKHSVFERFYRSETVEKMGIKGHGLGLSLVKAVLDEIGAQIRISDNKPTGTIVTVTIPAIIVEE
ncbi:MAG: HAMP domain-containing histidine kinase [Ignavibacterium sp.]|uniref:sensor histidine kinase n=1 Tax=Ignavibacterium sp. TaxID=2651167 RepID=UPI003298A7C3